MGAMARPIEAQPFKRSEEAFGDIVGFAGSQEADEMTESELERELEQRVRELKRQLLQDHLDRRGGGAAIGPVRDKAGQERIEVREHERKLRTTFGDVEVRRWGYGAALLRS